MAKFTRLEDYDPNAPKPLEAGPYKVRKIGNQYRIDKNGQAVHTGMCDEIKHLEQVGDLPFYSGRMGKHWFIECGHKTLGTHWESVERLYASPIPCFIAKRYGKSYFGTADGFLSLWADEVRMERCAALGNEPIYALRHGETWTVYQKDRIITTDWNRIRDIQVHDGHLLTDGELNGSTYRALDDRIVTTGWKSIVDLFPKPVLWKCKPLFIGSDEKDGIGRHFVAHGTKVLHGPYKNIRSTDVSVVGDACLCIADADGHAPGLVHKVARWGDQELISAAANMDGISNCSAKDFPEPILVASSADDHYHKKSVHVGTRRVSSGWDNIRTITAHEGEVLFTGNKGGQEHLQLFYQGTTYSVLECGPNAHWCIVYYHGCMTRIDLFDT